MKKITYVKSRNSDALSAEDWVTLERLLRSIISEQDKDGEDPVTFMQFHYAPNTIEVRLVFMDWEAKDFQSITNSRSKTY